MAQLATMLALGISNTVFYIFRGNGHIMEGKIDSYKCRRLKKTILFRYYPKLIEQAYTSLCILALIGFWKIEHYII